MWPCGLLCWTHMRHYFSGCCESKILLKLMICKGEVRKGLSLRLTYIQLWTNGMQIAHGARDIIGLYHFCNSMYRGYMLTLVQRTLLVYITFPLVVHRCQAPDFACDFMLKCLLILPSKPHRTRRSVHHCKCHRVLT
jgi:hypothetical protein